MGPNGLRIANGHPMSYTVIMPSDLAGQYLTRSFQIIQPDFKKIGVQLNLKVLDDSAAYDAILANNYRNFEISMWDWFPLTDPDFMLSVLTCNSFDVWNDTGYCSKAYDNLYSQQSAAMNPAQRQQIVYQMQQMIASRPAVPGDRLPGLDRGAEQPLEPPACGGRRLVQLDVEDPDGERAPGRLSGCGRGRARRLPNQAGFLRPGDDLRRDHDQLLPVPGAAGQRGHRPVPGPARAPALRHALLTEFGLDKPKWEQYLIYLKNLAHGNMGISFANQQPVSHLLIADLKNTIPMVTVGTVAAIVIGVFTGVLSAWRRGSAPDHVSTNAAIFFYAFPTQWLGLMLLILFAGILPAGGMSDPFLFTAEPFWPAPGRHRPAHDPARGDADADRLRQLHAGRPVVDAGDAG